MKISGSQPLKWDEPRRRTGRIVSDLHGRLSPRLNNSWLLSLHPPLHPLSLLSFFPALSSPCLSRAPLFRRSSLLSLLSHPSLPVSVLFSSHSSLPFLPSYFSSILFPSLYLSFLSSLPILSLFSASFLPFLASTLAPSREMEEEEEERERQERKGGSERTKVGPPERDKTKGSQELSDVWVRGRSASNRLY